MLSFDAIHRLKGLLADMPCPWYVCGGWALDLWLDRPTRPHKDLDVALARTDQRVARAFLRERGWDLQVADGGVLAPWDGEWLALPRHCIWCRREGPEPRLIELLLNEIDEAGFRFRREQTIRLPRERMSFDSSRGVRVLAPEIVLLYKANRPDGNAADFDNAVDRLTADGRAWLKGALTSLYGLHVWAGRL